VQNSTDGAVAAPTPDPALAPEQLERIERNGRDRAEWDALVRASSGSTPAGDLFTDADLHPPLFREADILPLDHPVVQAYLRFDRPEDADPEFPLLNVIDLAASWDDHTKPEMLVEGFLVKGANHTVFGAPDFGKTWIALAAFVVPMLRRRQVVVYIDKEMSRRDIINRLKELGVEKELAAEYLVYLELPTVDGSAASRAEWARILESRPGLVVVDAQAGVLADADLKENSTSDVLRWHSWYFDTARRAGATTVMLDHTGHENASRERGASGKEGIAKVRLQVTKVTAFDPETVGEVVVRRMKNNLGAPIPDVQRFAIGGSEDGFVFEPLAFSEEDVNTPASTWNRVRADVEARVVEAGEEGLTKNQLEGLVKGRAGMIRDGATDLTDDPTSPVQARAGARGAVVYYATSSDHDLVPVPATQGTDGRRSRTSSKTKTAGTKTETKTRSPAGPPHIKPFTTPDE